MSEESEGVISGPENNGAGVDPVAIALALGGASQTQADAFLKKQEALIDDQRHHLREQFKQVRLATLSQRLSVALKLATGAVGLVILVGVGIAVWNASQASGLVVESFSVPPQFANAGITGEVLSSDLDTKLGVMRDTANVGTLTRSGDVNANRDDDVKVEIPETGVSLAQAWRYLRLWLGHERRLRGNLRALPDGRIALSVALDDSDPLTVTGLPGDLDKLEQQAADHVYADVEPVNYALYLGRVGRRAEVMAAAERATRLVVGPVARADAFAFWASVTSGMDLRLAITRAHIALAIYPKSMEAYSELLYAFLGIGHDEEALAAARAMQDLREADQLASLQGQGFAHLVEESLIRRATALGDFALAATIADRMDRGNLLQAEYAARAHDTAQSRMAIDRAMAMASERILFNTTPNTARYYLDAATGNWQQAEVEARGYIATLKQYVAQRRLSESNMTVSAMPMLSVALARNGVFADAHAAADGMPMDCYDCLRARGQIAALEKNWSGADAWFARAAHAAPSIPFAYEDWGRSLLARGRPDAAIAQFTLANQKGPHFADALEGWGEALMAQNRSDLALAKFAESQKYAPNWGRLHLKWGEALVYAGKRDDAKAQLARAAQLDLTPGEKAELTRMGHV